MTELTPEDNLWLAIISRTPECLKMTEEQLRQFLLNGGFPKHVIEAALKDRKS